MKTIASSRFLIIALAFLLVSFSDPYTIKRITDTNFKYEFYTTDKTITAKVSKTYYWFKGGAIHNSQGGFNGQLLNGSYMKMYLSNQPAEQGDFEDGLKTGLWKTWYENGRIATTQYWSEGRRKGEYMHYEENGNLLEKGRYRRDLKQGQWIDFVEKDTLNYKNGAVVVKKPKKDNSGKKGFFGRLFGKKKNAPDSNPANENTSQKNNSEKKGFFGRLFGKKKNTSNSKPVKEPISQKDNSGKKGFFARLFGKKKSK